MRTVGLIRRRDNDGVEPYLAMVLRELTSFKALLGSA